jgi:hypothetical protein
MKKYYIESGGGGGGVIFTYTKMKANWIGYVLCWNCLIKHVVEETRED